MTAEQWREKAREVCEHSFLRGGPPIIEAVAEALAAAYAEGVRGAVGDTALIRAANALRSEDGGTLSVRLRIAALLEARAALAAAPGAERAKDITEAKWVGWRHLPSSGDNTDAP